MPATIRQLVRLGIVVGATLLARSTAAWVEIEDDTSLVTTAPAAAQSPRVASTIERQLSQVDALIEAAAYDEALTALDDLLAETHGGNLEVTPGKWLPLRTACHRRLATAPPALLAAYRARVDSLVEALWIDATQNRDEAILRRIVSEYFCSSRGDDALLLLGEYALERGDMDAARRCWFAIDPRLTDPAGRSWGLVAAADEIAGRRDEFVAEATKAKTIPLLNYPSTDIPIGDVLARLAVASLRAGELQRAATEVAMLGAFAPDAQGRLAGREGPLLPALQEMLTAAREWPPIRSTTDRASPLRSGTYSVDPLGPLAGAAWVDDAPANADSPVTAAMGQPITVPVAADGRVVYYRNSALVARDVRTGAPAITDSGELYREALVGAAVPGQQVDGFQIQQFRNQFGGGIVIQGRINLINGWPPQAAMSPQRGPVPLLMNVSLHDQMAYALLGSRAAAIADDPTPRLRSGPQRLLGLDLSREGLVAWEAELEDRALEPSGPAICAGDRVVVPLRQAEQGEVHVMAFDAATAKPVWQTTVAQLPPATPGYPTANHDLLCVSGDAAYFDTGQGLLVALDLHSGETLWSFSYALGTSDRPRNLQQQGRHMPCACLVAGGLVYIAPREAASMYAIDAATGQVAWQRVDAWDVDTLVGVVDGKLVAGGQRLWIVDARSGVPQFVWPTGIQSGIRGCGQGCIAGSEVFWPTRGNILTFDLHSVQRTRLPIAYPLPGAENGVVLVAADERLIVATDHGIAAIGPQAAPIATAPQEPNLQ